MGQERRKGLREIAGRPYTGRGDTPPPKSLVGGALPRERSSHQEVIAAGERIEHGPVSEFAVEDQYGDWHEVELFPHSDDTGHEIIIGKIYPTDTEIAMEGLVAAMNQGLPHPRFLFQRAFPPMFTAGHISGGEVTIEDQPRKFEPETAAVLTLEGALHIIHHS